VEGENMVEEGEKGERRKVSQKKISHLIL